MTPLLNFRCYHYTSDHFCDPHGIAIDVEPRKTTLKNVLDSIVLFHKIENPTRVILNVAIAKQVIAVSNQGKLKVVAKFEDDPLFASVFEKCHGLKNELTVRVNFSQHVYITPKTPCCDCVIV
jgi:hypothetical protein